MANNTFSRIGGSGELSDSRTRFGEPYRILVDFAQNIVKSGGIASGDTLEIFDIPANCRITVLSVYAFTALSLGTSGTLSVGDTSSGTAFVNAGATLTAGTEFTLVSGSNTSGKIYRTADKLYVTAANSGGTITSGKLWLVFNVTRLDCMTAVPGAF